MLMVVVVYRKRTPKTAQSDFGCGVLVISSSQEGLPKVNDYQQKSSGCREWGKKKNKGKNLGQTGQRATGFEFCLCGNGGRVEVKGQPLTQSVFVGPGFQAFFGYEQDYGRSVI